MNKFSKKNITKILGVALSGMLFFGGCGGTDSNVDDNKTSDADSDNLIKIGIIQLQEHPALDSAREGFIEGLSEAGYKEGESIVIEQHNAQGDQSNLKIMNQKLVTNKSDLILAISTPVAQSLIGETKDIPILVTAVTDPEKSQLVESNDKPGGNVTGTSDLTPIGKQFDLMNTVFPEIETLGMMYSSSEPNSEIQIEVAKKLADQMNLKYEIATVSAQNDIPQVAENLAGKVDAIYIPTDNDLTSAMELVVKSADEKNIPVIAAERGAVEKGALMTDGLDYFDLGKQTAEMAVRILEEKEEPSNMSIEYIDKTTIVINMETAERLGVDIPQEILDKADLIEKSTKE